MSGVEAQGQQPNVCTAATALTKAVTATSDASFHERHHGRWEDLAPMIVRLGGRVSQAPTSVVDVNPFVPLCDRVAAAVVACG
jgi:hypothetical protein